MVGVLVNHLVSKLGSPSDAVLAGMVLRQKHRWLRSTASHALTLSWRSSPIISGLRLGQRLNRRLHVGSEPTHVSLSEVAFDRREFSRLLGVCWDTGQLEEPTASGRCSIGWPLAFEDAEEACFQSDLDPADIARPVCPVHRS